MMDFNDESIRDMVESTHRPEETKRHNTAAIITVFDVVCMQCGEEWPCEKITVLREWKKANRPLDYQD